MKNDTPRKLDRSISLLPVWLDALIDKPFNSKNSVLVDKWLWYCQQEFEFEGVQR